MKLEQLPERYKQQALRQIGDQSASASAKRKRDTGNAPSNPKKTARSDRPDGFTRPVSITYRDTRRRFLDSDNGWTKYFTDALITAGILQDDTTKQIPERPKVIQRKAI